MIVCRWLYSAKVGQVNEVRDLIAALVDRDASGQITWRVYASRYGQLETVALEGEFESLADFEKRNNDAMATPEVQALVMKLLPLLRSPIVMEFWSRER
jgi:hypothetical protein